MNPHIIEIPFVSERVYIALTNCFEGGRVYEDQFKTVVRGERIEHPENVYVLQGNPIVLSGKELEPGDAVTLAKELNAVLVNNKGVLARWHKEMLRTCFPFDGEDGEKFCLRPPTCRTNKRLVLTGWRVHCFPDYNLYSESK